MSKSIFDKETQKWFNDHPTEQTTVVKCELCDLMYKPSLGHKCKKVKQEKITEEEAINLIKEENKRHQKEIDRIMLLLNPDYSKEYDRR